MLVPESLGYDKAPEVVNREGITVTSPVTEPEPASGLVTVRLRGPSGAPAVIAISAVSWVALVTLTLLAVTPELENVTLAPVWKPAPVMVILMLSPWWRTPGETVLIVAGALTVITLLVILVWVPLLAVTLKVPIVADEGAERVAVA